MHDVKPDASWGWLGGKDREVLLGSANMPGRADDLHRRYVESCMSMTVTPNWGGASQPPRHKMDITRRPGQMSELRGACPQVGVS